MQLLYADISKISLDSLLRETFFKSLPEKEKERISKLRQEKDQVLSLVGFALLSSIAGELHGLKRSVFGKPYLEKGDHYFNISHSGSMVVCAVSSLQELGVDIEEIKPINREDFKVVFRNEELEKMNSLSAFYDIWTQKEALIKVLGFGFSMEAKDLIIENDKCSYQDAVWYLKKENIGENYACHLAMSKQEEIQIHKVSFDELLTKN